MSLNGITPIDQLAQERFLHHFSKIVPVPEAILTEYTLKSPIMAMSSASTQAHFLNKTYAEAIGYEFSWGHILERRFNQYIVWDFCLSTLLMAYLHAGQRLEDCQRQMFKALEKQFNCTSRDVMSWISLDNAWQLCPSSSVGIFSLLVHFTSEDQAKHWVVRELLSAFPELIASAQQRLDATFDSR